MDEASTYAYVDASDPHTSRYIWPAVDGIIQRDKADRLFELGCGNGAYARHLADRGISVTGVDPSEEGIAIARRAAEDSGNLRVAVGSAYDDLASQYGTFPVVASLEVVEHVYAPRKFAHCVHDLLDPGGLAIISTPYHSYLKNLALAVSGKMDTHFTALWDHGHIKFWSVQTLTRLFAEQNMRREEIIRVGRIPILAKSMILTFRKDG